MGTGEGGINRMELVAPPLSGTRYRNKTRRFTYVKIRNLEAIKYRNMLTGTMSVLEEGRNQIPRDRSNANTENTRELYFKDDQTVIHNILFQSKMVMISRLSPKMDMLQLKVRITRRLQEITEINHDLKWRNKNKLFEKSF